MANAAHIVDELRSVRAQLVAAQSGQPTAAPSEMMGADGVLRAVVVKPGWLEIALPAGTYYVWVGANGQLLADTKAPTH